MQYVHGHACIHNLIDYSRVYSSDPYKLLIESKTSCVWAIHPFTKCKDFRMPEYDLVCEEFGYTLEKVEHPWNSLDVHGLWNVAKQFSWRQHIAPHGPTADGMLNDILRAGSVYTQWYENIFKDGFKTSSGYDIPLQLNDWYKLIGIGPK